MEKTSKKLLKEFVESDATVYETIATVYETNATAGNNNLTFSEGNASGKSSVAELPFIKGEMLLDTYRIVSDPISGGMGNVWRVHHQNWNVDLAMKRPKSQLFQSEAEKEHFKEECKSWINLGLHPNIVSCYYVREIGGVPTIFSEWMENGSLEERILDKSLYTGMEQEQQERLLDIAIQFARGLHYAHEQGLLHQDVKPANLMLSKEWDAKVADFGLARARAQLTVPDGVNIVSDDGAAVMTHSGAYYTPAYCSMEQMDGQLLTRRTDIYSWAVSILEMYMGCRPWTNGTVAGLNCRDYFTDTRVSMPEELSNLLANCLASELEKRPCNFAEIEERLLKIYQSEIGRGYPSTVYDFATDTVDSLNNRALSYLDLGMEEQAEAYWQQAAEREPEHLQAVYNFNLWLWRSGYINSTELEYRCSPVFRQNTPERKRLEGQLKAEIKDADPMTLHVWCYTRIGNIQFILDFEGLLSCSRTDSDYVIWEKNKSEWLDVVRDTKPSGCGNLLLTKNCRYLIYYHLDYSSAVYVADANSGETVYVLRNSRCILLDVCVHPDSDSIYTINIDHELCKWSICSGKLVYCVKYGPPVLWNHICIRPLDHRIYVSTSNKIEQYDGKTGRYLGAWNLELGESKMCLSPDGRRLYFITDNGVAYCNTQTGDVIHPEECLRVAKACLEQRQKDASIERSYQSGRRGRSGLWISPDGKKLLLCNDSGVIELWDTDLWRRIRIFQRQMQDFQKYHPDRIYDLAVTVVVDTSIIIARIIAHSDHSVLIWQDDKSIQRAAWELSAVRNYVQQVALKQKIEEENSAIEECIRNKDMVRAIRLLEQAEQRFDFHAFLALRSKLQQLCRHGGFRNAVEIAAISIPFLSKAQFDSSAITADPGENRFVAVSDQCLIMFDGYGQKMPGINDRVSAPGCPCFSPSGKFLAVAAEDGVLVFNMEKMALYRRFENSSEHERRYVRLEFTPDDKQLLACNYYGFAGIWDIGSGKLLQKFSKAHKEDRFSDAVFINNGSQVLIAYQDYASSGYHAYDYNYDDRDAIFKIYDVQTGSRMDIIQSGDVIGKVCKSPDEKILYAHDGINGDKIGVWNISDLTKRQILDFETSQHSNLCISPDGTVLAVSGEKETVLMSMPDGKILWKSEHLVSACVNNIAFSPDQSTLCVGVNGFVHLYSLRWQLLPPDKEL